MPFFAWRDIKASRVFARSPGFPLGNFWEEPMHPGQSQSIAARNALYGFSSRLKNSMMRCSSRSRTTGSLEPAMWVPSIGMNS
jgi:hypothetical protein